MRFVVLSVLMWCPEYDVSFALDLVIFLPLSVLKSLCEMIFHLAPVSSRKFTLTPSTSMVLNQPVPTKYSVSELSDSMQINININSMQILLVRATGKRFLSSSHLLKVIFCVALPVDFTHGRAGSTTMLPTTSTTCRCIGL